MNPKHEIFIKEMIEHGDRTKAYLTAYPGTQAASARSAAQRLLARNPQVGIRIEEGLKRIQREMEGLRIEGLQEKVTGFRGIREILTAILSGDKTFEKVYKSGSELKRMHLEIGEGGMLRALELCMRIAKELPGVNSQGINEIIIDGERFT